MQIEDLQAALDCTITELEIARSLLSNQRQQEMAAHLQEQEQRPGPFTQNIAVFPMRAEFGQTGGPGEQYGMD